MEDNKIRIGITQGDINGVGYEVILKTFSDPMMLELCTPDYLRFAQGGCLSSQITGLADEFQYCKFCVRGCAESSECSELYGR